MKRYLLFAYEAYEAYGGINDLIGVYDTFELAKQSVPKCICFCQIVDTYTNTVIEYWTDTKKETKSEIVYKTSLN